MPHDTHVVVLQADADQLAELALTLAMAGIPHAPVHENDEPFSGQLVAVGISPLVRRQTIRRFVSALPLLGKGRATPD